MFQKTAFAAGPVYTNTNELSTKDIEEKIQKINEAEVLAREEEVTLDEEVNEEIEELTDIVATEIVAEEVADEIASEIVEEIEELTDLEAAEIVAEELAE